MAKLQTSPGNALSLSRLCPPHLRTSFPYRYRTLKIFAFSSCLHASYAISVRRASVLPAASFRFHLAMDTLAVQLTIPPVGFVGDFHSLVNAPCRAHKRKARPRKRGRAVGKRGVKASSVVIDTCRRRHSREVMHVLSVMFVPLHVAGGTGKQLFRRLAVVREASNSHAD